MHRRNVRKQKCHHAAAWAVAKMVIEIDNAWAVAKMVIEIDNAWAVAKMVIEIDNAWVPPTTPVGAKTSA
jgi:hypothetical protein